MSIVDQLREIARGPATQNAGGLTDALNVITKAADKIERLQAVKDAAQAFLTEPPIGLNDNVPCQQYTTAGDCRRLLAAFRAAGSEGD
jgi:hypothetical protein